VLAPVPLGRSVMVIVRKEVDLLDVSVSTGGRATAFTGG
jgi:hypothetical protein